MGVMYDTFSPRLAADRRSQFETAARHYRLARLAKRSRRLNSRAPTTSDH